MKGKFIGSMLLIIIAGSFFLFKPRSTQSTHPNKMRSSAEKIVAPAMIDSLSDITHIPALQSGVLKKLNVVAGQRVAKGQPLFSLESSLVENNVNIQKIMLQQAQNQLQIQQQKITHNKAQLARLSSLDQRAVSQSDLQNKQYEVNMETIQLTQAQRQLALAVANLKQAELIRDQYSVVAPKNGIVLQVNAHVNEFVGSSQPVVLLGDIHKVMVRVSLDERDIMHFQPTKPAFLTSNENKKLKIPITFLRLNQYVVTQERLNFSHVQEAIYYFNRKDYPHIIAGQQLDANIPINSHA